MSNRPSALNDYFYLGLKFSEDGICEGSSYLLHMNFAGTPAQTSYGGISFVTTEPAPITTPSPTVTGFVNIVLEPM